MHVDIEALIPVSFKAKVVKPPVPFKDAEFVNNLKKIELVQSYGTKIDMIVRHIKFLLANDPTVKVLCFSQWDDVLKILGQALRQQDIGWISLEGKGWDPINSKPFGIQKKGQSVSKFINSPSVSCFMLHAKSHSAGLTLVAATHVFLIEPFLYKGYEQQALARVHRIGQTKPTFVWRFLISDTVEEALVNANIGNSSEIQKLGTRDHGEVIDGEFLEKLGILSNLV
jgi:E3 ubiquitin-protein ligase SHPRH